jgi:hypothetical protein
LKIFLFKTKDVVCGLAYSLVVLVFYLPWIDEIDRLQMQQPHVTVLGGFALCCLYPGLKEWNTGRYCGYSVIGTTVGFTVGSYLYDTNEYFYESIFDASNLMTGILTDPYGVSLLRTAIGLFCLLAAQIIFKELLLRIICFVNGMNSQDETSKKTKKFELPFYFANYACLGAAITYMVPVLFKLINL